MIKPPASTSIIGAAAILMADAYMKALVTVSFPRRLGKIMYAARGQILRLTGLTKFSDKYLTQVLLPNYINEHPEETA